MLTWTPGQKIGALGALTLAVGSIGPWARISAGFFSASVSGLRGDGAITLGLGVAAGLILTLLAHPRWLQTARVLGVIAVLVVVYDMVNLSRVGPAGSIDWGIVLALVGSCVLVYGAGRCISQEA